MWSSGERQSSWGPSRAPQTAGGPLARDPRKAPYQSDEHELSSLARAFPSSTVVVALLQRFRLRVPTALGEEDGVFDLEGYEREYKDFFVSGRSCVEVVLEVRGG